MVGVAFWLCIAFSKLCKLPATEVAGVYNPESWFDLFGLSLSDYLIFIFTFRIL